MPKFSVVIAVYNKAKYLKKTLDSVLSQSYTNFEIIIVNDGSTDESESIIKEYADSRISYFKQTNQGAAAARNTAIKHANEPWIALLDADDYWYDKHLEELNRLIEKYPKEQVFTTASEVERNGTIFPSHYQLIMDENEQDALLDYFPNSYSSSLLHSSTTVLHKDVFEKVGYYDNNIKSGQDTDLYIRIALKYRVVFSKKITARYILLADGLFSTTTNTSHKANLDRYDPFIDTHKGLRKFLSLNRYSIALFARLNGDTESFRRLRSKIHLDDLNNKQRFLLKAPLFLVKILLWFKKSMEKRGRYLSAYK